MNKRSYARKFCECGQPATVVHNSARICERCFRIESDHERRAKLKEQRHEVELADVFTVRGISY